MVVAIRFLAYGHSVIAFRAAMMRHKYQLLVLCASENFAWSREEDFCNGTRSQPSYSIGFKICL